MQFVGKMITSVSEFYKDINPSTLSGAIDVLVVEDAKTGQLSCSPFHVRFGKLQLLRPQEKVVDVKINGRSVDVRMKVGEAGETFFVLATDGNVPAEYLTSPLAMPLPATRVEPLSLSPEKALREKSIPRPVSDSEDFSGDNRTIHSGQNRLFRASAALSDSELDLANNKPPPVGSPPKYSWMWGGLPQKTKVPESTEGDPELAKSLDDPIDNSSAIQQDPVELEVSAKVGGKVLETGLIGTAIELTAPVSLEIPFISNDSSVDSGGPFTAVEAKSNNDGTATPLSQISPPTVPASVLIDIFDYLTKPAVFKDNYEKFLAIPIDKAISIAVYKTHIENEKFYIDPVDGSISSIIEQVERTLERLEWETFSEDPTAAILELSGRRLMLIDGQILMGASVGHTLVLGRTLFGRIMSYESVIKKYPALGMAATSREKERKSSWRWWSRGNNEIIPPGTTIEPIDLEIAKARSNSSSKSTTPTDPNGTFDVNSISLPAMPPSPVSNTPEFCASDKSNEERIHYTKSLRLPHDLLVQLDLQPGVNSITYTVTTRLQGTATCTARIFRWRSDNRLIISDIDGTITKSEALGHLFAIVGRDWTHSDIAKLYSAITANGYHFVYLTSRPLGQANITRGYLRGIEQNGRFQLPDGPVIMSPDRLLTALRREVVLNNPQEFKIACLRDLQKLFYGGVDPTEGPNPFYAGFGNRTNDTTAYLAIGIPPSRIFIVNPSGTVSIEPLADQYAGSYAQLIELVDSVFPPLTQDPRGTAPAEEPFNDFWYWRRPTSLAELKEDQVVTNLSQVDLRVDEDEEEEESLIPAYYV